jgi:hypothetical protein
MAVTICVSLQLVGVNAGPGLNQMKLSFGKGAAPKLVPVIVSTVPAEPLVGLIEVIVGWAVTVMSKVLLAPSAVVTCTATVPPGVVSGMNA